MEQTFTTSCNKGEHYTCTGCKCECHPPLDPRADRMNLRRDFDVLPRAERGKQA